MRKYKKDVKEINHNSFTSAVTDEIEESIINIKKIIARSEKISPDKKIILSEIEKSEKILKNLIISVKKIYPDLKEAEKIQNKELIISMSNTPPINELSSLYRKTQANTHKLVKLEKLIKLYNTIESSGHLVERTKSMGKIVNLSTKLDYAEDTAKYYLQQQLEINWHLFNNDEKHKINRMRSLLIKNSIKHLELKQEIFFNKDDEKFTFTNSALINNLYNENRLTKLNGMLLMFQEDLEKEEQIINEWLLVISKKSLIHENHNEKDIIQAIDYLERYHRQSEWFSLYERQDKYYIKMAQSYEEISESQHRIDMFKFMNDKARNLSAKIYSVFGSKIEERRRTVSKKEVIKKQSNLEDIIKNYQSLLGRVLN